MSRRSRYVPESRPRRTKSRYVPEPDGSMVLSETALEPTGLARVPEVVRAETALPPTLQEFLQSFLAIPRAKRNSLFQLWRERIHLKRQVARAEDWGMFFLALEQVSVSAVRAEHARLLALEQLRGAAEAMRDQVRFDRELAGLRKEAEKARLEADIAEARLRARLANAQD